MSAGSNYFCTVSDSSTLLTGVQPLPSALDCFSFILSRDFANEDTLLRKELIKTEQICYLISSFIGYLNLSFIC